MSTPDAVGAGSPTPGTTSSPSSSGVSGKKPEEGRSSILETLRKISGIVLSMVHSRLDLFATELEEERRRLGWALIFGGILFVSAVGAFLSALLFIFAVAYVFHVLIPMLGIFALVLAAIAIAMVFRLKALYSQRDRFFHYTLEELRKDIIGIRRVFIKKGPE